jgi:hypothetical protein
MPRASVVLALVGLASVAGACRTSPTPERLAEWDRGALIHTKTREVHVIYSSQKGKVGYLKVKDVTDAGGPTYPWRYVYDLDMRELGFINQFGGAYQYHVYSQWEAARENEPMRLKFLPSDSIERNVMRMLGIDPALDNVTFPMATQADFAAVDAKPPLAGPGVVPPTAAGAAAGEPVPVPAK